jgi:gamma-glutamylcyclotransferase
MAKVNADRILYFAYGSNLNKTQMVGRCRNSVPVGRAYLKNYDLEFLGNSRGTGVANVREEKGMTVPGALWLITEDCLRALDRYEGYPTLYGRKWMTVRTDEGKYVRALVYYMKPGYVAVSPSEYYLDIIVRGYEDFKINYAEALYERAAFCGSGEAI